MFGLFKKDTETPKYDFVTVDIETTGSSVLEHDIYEIAMVKIVKGKVKKEFRAYIVEEALPESIYRRRGMSQEDLDNALTYQQALKKFEKFTKGYPVIAHNSRFDRGFIEYKFREYLGRPIDRVWMCTLSMSRKSFPFLERHTLAHVAYHLNIPNDKHHQALNDARVCADIVLCLIGKKPVATKDGLLSKASRAMSKFFLKFSKKGI